MIAKVRFRSILKMTKSKEDKNSGKKSGKETERSNEDKKADREREYAEAELKRQREQLRKEAEKIKKPEQKEFMPYTFNALEPYFDLSMAEFVHELQPDVRHGYTSRALATGLCEPQVSHRMDIEIPPKAESQPSPRRSDNQKQKSKERNEAEGSTRLPPYPTVKFDMSAVPKKKQYLFTDVPSLRAEVRAQFNPNGHKRVDMDYRRTKEDFYRMELDKMEEYRPGSRPHMRAAYFAYLQNTAGSRRAVHECVQSVEGSGGKDGSRRQREDEDRQNGEGEKVKEEENEGKRGQLDEEKTETNERDRRERKEKEHGRKDDSKDAANNRRDADEKRQKQMETDESASRRGGRQADRREENETDRRNQAKRTDEDESMRTKSRKVTAGKRKDDAKTTESRDKKTGYRKDGGAAGKKPETHEESVESDEHKK